jgi:hypothetical protein
LPVLLSLAIHTVLINCVRPFPDCIAVATSQLDAWLKKIRMTSPVDIITLENFESKMPRWNPSSSNHLYALVDMGR